MNYRGSYRKLLGNARAALVAAIDVYNKPMFQYRDECFVILLLNAWELLLKAIVSKNRKSIYYPKKRREPYRTLSWKDAFDKAQQYLTPVLPAIPIRHNLDLLGNYRDNSIHFYNEKDFGVLIFGLAQTSILNFRDVLSEMFQANLREDINWRLMPLGLEPPIDPVTYIARKREETGKVSNAVVQYLAELARAVQEVEAAGKDTGRLLSVFVVRIESIKKIEQADVLVGLGGGGANPGALAIIRRQDPNVTHPLRQLDIVGKNGVLREQGHTPFTFQAIVWKYELKSKPQYCWAAKEGVLIKYSNDIIPWINRLTQREVETALNEYKVFLHTRRQTRVQKGEQP